ncbi:heme-copper oxidase subunit III [bacterium]|nr:heme-copper oxidase subunit III [bacterium]
MALSIEDRRKVGRPLLWLGMASMLMAFAGLTSGYVVSRSALMTEGLWMSFALPIQFLWSTLVIGLSSLAMIAARGRIRADDTPNVTRLVWIAFALGLGFAALQLLGWHSMVEAKIFFADPTNTAGSWVYAISGLHLAHMIAGLIVLMVTGFRAAKGRYTPGNEHGFVLSATFWHFLGVLWLYLYGFMAFIR